jgi:hypothetical protein
MGTSISHKSPSTSGWKMASQGYINPDISIRRIVAEIWRATQSQPKPLQLAIKSEAVFDCGEALRDSTSAIQALKIARKKLIETKKSSVVTELAKRTIPEAFQAKNPTKAWRSLLFSTITDYLVSRDISSYVGSKFRNKSISELISFKTAIRGVVKTIVEKEKTVPTSFNDWGRYVEKIVHTLSNEK